MLFGVVFVVLILLGGCYLLVTELVSATSEAFTILGRATRTTLLVFVCFIAFDCPGMIVMFLVNQFALPGLDLAQIWTFSIVLSLMAYGLAVVAGRLSSAQGVEETESRSGSAHWKGGAVSIVVFFAGTVLVMLVATFGFKAQFPIRILELFFPILTPVGRMLHILSTS